MPQWLLCATKRCDVMSIVVVSKDRIFPHAKRAGRYSSYIPKAVVGIACYCCQFDVRDR